MAKKFTVNFEQMDSLSKSVLVDWYSARKTYAEQQINHQNTMKDLDAELVKILENRQIDIDAGLDPENVAKKFPRDDVDSRILAEKESWKKASSDLNKRMNVAYKEFLPATETVTIGEKVCKVSKAYVAYLNMVKNGKRGEFVAVCRKFCVDLGITATSQGQVNKFAERMSVLIGAKIASSAVVLATGHMTMEQSAKQFNKLFLSAFCDTYLAQLNKFIDAVDEKTAMEACKVA